MVRVGVRVRVRVRARVRVQGMLDLVRAAARHWGAGGRRLLGEGVVVKEPGPG